MQTEPEVLSKQRVYRAIVVGTLIYSVVLGFFADYTNVLFTTSYSTTFSMALVMQVMVFPTLLLKKKIANWFKGRSGKYTKFAMVMSLWLVMFLSKFVFLAVLDIVFSGSVEIRGFFGLVAIILCATILQQIADYFDKRLEK